MKTSKLKELYVQKIVTEMDANAMFRMVSDFMLKDYEKYDVNFIHSCILNELNERYDEKTVAEFLQSVEEAELNDTKAHTNLTHTLPNMETYRITQIDFNIDDEDLTTYDVNRINELLQERYIHSEWIVEEDEETSISDLISDECGWCINSLDYRLVRS